MSFTCLRDCQLCLVSLFRQPQHESVTKCDLLLSRFVAANTTDTFQGFTPYDFLNSCGNAVNVCLTL